MGIGANGKRVFRLNEPLEKRSVLTGSVLEILVSLAQPQAEAQHAVDKCGAMDAQKAGRLADIIIALRKGGDYFGLLGLLASGKGRAHGGASDGIDVRASAMAVAVLLETNARSF